MTASATATSAKDPKVLDKSTPVILSIAFPYAPVGSKAVGGAEVICSQLEAALPSLGFNSVVVAHANSDPVGQLYGTQIPAGEITNEVRRQVEHRQQASIDRALAEHPVALVHMHGLDFDRYYIPEHLPVIVTLHLPPAWYPKSIWSLPANYHLVCVSQTQWSSCPETAHPSILVIENGVPLPPKESLRAEGRYALMLARICPEKNLHVGLDAARLAGIGALLGGEAFPYAEHQRYLKQDIEPRLTSSGKEHQSRGRQAENSPVARFLGPVAGDDKQRLLSRAACLLLPSLAPETSSLVAMEALSAGVPVIGMAVGAVPEIVEHGRTGFLLEPREDAAQRMADLIKRLPEISRTTCRETAEERFSFGRMLNAYCRIYRQFAATPAPRCIRGESSAADISPRIQKANLRVSTIDAAAMLDSLQVDWTSLWHQDRGATPFQHPAWLLPWWNQFGPDGELHSLAVHDARTGRLLALAPLYIYQEPANRERKLLFVGAGTTDYLDGLWTSNAAVLAECVIDELLRNRAWDAAYLSQLRASSTLLEAARASSLDLIESETCSTIDVSSLLPPKIRRNVNRYRRRAEQAGVTCDLAQTPEGALSSFEHLVRLHQERWEGRGEPGVLSDARVLAHHRESLPLLLEAGLLRLFRLSTREGETIGVLYGFADAQHAADRRLYLYLVGFDQRFADLSPGTLLVHEAWLHAREHGFVKLDLLRGGEDYKQLWGAAAEPTFTLRID